MSEGRHCQIPSETSAKGILVFALWCRLKEHVRSHKHEGERLSLPRHLKVVGQIEHLVITLGSLRLDCPAAVVGELNWGLGLWTPKVNPLPPSTKPSWDLRPVSTDFFRAVTQRTTDREFPAQSPD